MHPSTHETSVPALTEYKAQSEMGRVWVEDRTKACTMEMELKHSACSNVGRLKASETGSFAVNFQRSWDSEFW